MAALLPSVKLYVPLPTVVVVVEVGGSPAPIPHTLHEQHRVDSGPGSSVGIATGYGLDGPGIDYRKDPPLLRRRLNTLYRKFLFTE